MCSSQVCQYRPSMLSSERTRALFKRMVSRAQIEHRYSFLKPSSIAQRIDSEGFYTFGAFPDTKPRMQYYERHAFSLAQRALDLLGLPAITVSITHLILSRKILRRFGNMFSATIMFVFQDMMEDCGPSGPGCAMAFGPGVTIESMLFKLPGSTDEQRRVGTTQQ